MTIALTRIGNSKAVIIPAKILRKMNITENTVLELKESKDSIVISKTAAKKMDPVLPKVALPEILPEELEKFRNGLISFSKEEIAADERLSYILNR